MDLLFEKGEYKLAEEFCSDQLFQIEGGKSLLNIVFEKYMGFEPEVGWENLNNFLSKYCQHTRLDKTRVLESLPGDLKLSDTQIRLYDFLFNSLNSTNLSKNQSLIQQQMQAVYFENLNAKLANYQKKHVVINDEVKCTVCSKKIGSKPFYLFPNGLIIDQACAIGRNLSQCPLTGEPFNVSNSI